MNAAPKARVDRERVLVAASELANRHGLDQLSMSELALALGIRTPSLYTHVAGLSELHRLLALKFSIPAHFLKELWEMDTSMEDNNLLR